MALPASGTIRQGADVNVELGNSATTQIALGQASVRSLYGVASGAIRLAADGYGKSNVLPRYVLSATPSTMAISPDKTKVAYFSTSGTAMNVWVFNTSNFSLAYAKTSTVINSNTTIYGAVGAFDSSNNLLVAQSSYTSPAGGGFANNNISFVLYNSTGTLVASRYSGSGDIGVHGLSTAFFANGFFYVSGRINNKGQIIKRSSTNLVFSADLLRSNNNVYASGNASENNAYSLDDVYQSFNNVAITNLSTASNTYKKHVPASQYSASYGATGAVSLRSTTSVMASNYLIEERMEGTWSITGPEFSPTTSFTNPKPYTFITNISSTNTATSCYAIFHDSLAALKLASQRAGNWPSSFGASSWNNNTMISDLRDNLIVIVGDTYFFNSSATPKLSYTGAHLTIFNTLTNVVIASAVCTSPTGGTSSPTGTISSVLGITGASVGGLRTDSPTLAITNEYLYIGKNIIPRPQSSSSLATTLNSIGAGLTWSAATTTVSSVAVTTTTPTLSTHVLTMADTAYTPTITTYTPTPSFTSI